MSNSVQNTTKIKASKWNLVSWKALYLLLITSIFLINYSKVYDAKLGLMGDNVSYLSLGKSLADGNGYRMQHLAQNPEEVSIPILYPFIVSCFMEENVPIADNLGVIKKLNGFFFWGFLIVGFLLFNRLGNNEHISFFVICVLLFNSHLLRYSFVSMSEMSFVFWVFLSLLFFTKIDFSISPFKSVCFWLSIVLLLLSYHTRALGLSLLGGYMVYFVLTKRWSYLGVLVLSFFLLIIPWHYYVSVTGESLHFNQILAVNPYQPELGKMSSFSDWSNRWFNNLERYFSLEFYSAVTGKNPDYVISLKSIRFDFFGFLFGVLTVVISMIGVLSMVRYRTLVLGFFLGTMVVVLCWPPAWYGTRFIIAFIPMLVFFFVLGVNRVVAYVYEKIQQKEVLKFPYEIHLGALTSCVLIYIASSGYIELVNSAKDDYPQKYKNYFMLADWTNAHVSEDAIVSCRKPGLFHVFSNRKVSGFLNDSDLHKVYERLISDEIDYVVLDGLGFTSTSKYLHPVTLFYKGKFSVVKSIGEGGKIKNPQNSLMNFDDSMGYHGEYEVGKKSGAGRFDYWDGSYYQGYWGNDFKNGYGEYYWEDGMVFKGTWHNDKREGKGMLTVGGSFQYIGNWKNDMMQGEFEVKDYEKGIYYNAYFEDDEMIMK